MMTKEYSIIVDHVYVSYRMVNTYSIKDRLTITKEVKRPRIVEFQALKDISFKVERGHTVGIIGSNGSGKSTLLKTLAGVFQPDSGEIKTYSNSISLLSLGMGFESDLAGIENIYLNGIFLGIPRKLIDEKLQEIIDFADIGEFIYNPVRTYSSGMRSRLAFAIASNIRPDILLIDEVLGVGDEDFREKSKARMRELIESERTVVIVSHSTSTIMENCDVTLWLERGEVMDFGDTKKVVNEYLDFVKKKRAEKK